jgi:hypothetical protein
MLISDLVRRSGVRAIVIGCTFAAAAAVGGGCGTTRSSGDAPGIGPAGGQITLADGSSITIPPGALSAQVAIGMAPLSQASQPGSGVVGGNAYSLTPDGLTFAVPVTLTIAFSPSALPAGTKASDLVLLTAPAEVTDYAYAMQTIVVDATHVAAQTSHFSHVWPAARNAASGGQRIGTTGTQGGAGGASDVCFTAGCTTKPPADICAGRAEPCGGTITISCCGSDVCIDGACASSGTKSSGGGKCGDNVPTCVFYGACTTHADCVTMNAADTACQTFPICGADGSCCPKAGAPCNSPSDCCQGLACNAHVCSSATQEPDPCQGGAGGGGGASASGGGGSSSGGATGGNAALVCAVSNNDGLGYPQCDCRAWPSRSDAEANYPVGAVVSFGSDPCPSSLSGPFTHGPEDLDCCTRGPVTAGSQVYPAGPYCQCTTSVGFPNGMADCTTWATELGGTRAASCP